MADTKRQQIIAAVRARLETILVAAGYKTDIGKHVCEWDETALDPNLETMRLDMRELGGTQGYEGVGEHLHVMRLQIRVRTLDNETQDTRVLAAQTVQDAMSDVYQIMADPLQVQLGGLSQDISQDGPNAPDYGEKADRAAGDTVVYMIEYTTMPGNPYA